MIQPSDMVVPSRPPLGVAMGRAVGPRHRPRAVAITAAAGLAAALCTMPGTARAQSDPRGSFSAFDPAGSSSEFTGKDFAGTRFPIGTVRGEMWFSASRVHTWGYEQADSGNAVRRLLLSGDVRVRLGVYEFTAARAVVWLERLSDPLSALDQSDPLNRVPPNSPAPREDDAGVYQVFVYFDRVASPNADATISVAADRLPVRAVVDVVGPIGLRTDLRRDAEPVDPLVREGEQALSRTLRLSEGAEEVEPIEIDRYVPSNAMPGELRPFLPKTARELQLQGERDLSKAADKFGTQIGGPIFARDGIITVAPGDLSLVTGEEENSLVISKGLVIQYTDPRAGRGLQLTA